MCTSCAPTFTLNKALGTYGTCACTTSQYLTASNTCASCNANATTCAATTGLATGCLATYTNNNGLC